MKININKVYKSDARLNAFPEVKAFICRIQNTLALHGCYDVGAAIEQGLLGGLTALHFECFTKLYMTHYLTSPVFEKIEEEFEGILGVLQRRIQEYLIVDKNLYQVSRKKAWLPLKAVLEYDLPMNALAYLLTIAQLDGVRKLKAKIKEIADFKVKPKRVVVKNTNLNKNSWAYEVKTKLSHIGGE